MRALFTLLFLTMLASPSHAACQIERYRFSFGSDTSTTWTASAGSVCTSHPSAGRGAGIESVAISQPPQHGAAHASGSSVYPEITYKPQGGYKGTDQFTFTITGGGRRLQGASNIHVSVEVK